MYVCLLVITPSRRLQKSLKNEHTGSLLSFLLHQMSNQFAHCEITGVFTLKKDTLQLRALNCVNSRVNTFTK